MTVQDEVTQQGIVLTDAAASKVSALISQEGGHFPAQNVHRLIGPQATLANLRNELEHWLPENAKDDDRVVIYFAGHGFVLDGKAYLAPYDVDQRNVAALKKLVRES